MTKHELVELALDQLIEAFRSSPESFTYEDREYSPNKMTSMPTIMWQPQVELKEEHVVQDPNNEQKTVIAVMNTQEKLVSCYIFSKVNLTLSNVNGNYADAIITSKHEYFFTLRANYRKFNKLKKLIIDRDRQREKDRFLKRLCAVFPATLDSHILK